MRKIFLWLFLSLVPSVLFADGRDYASITTPLTEEMRPTDSTFHTGGVALVMSGGAARGITHIGVIKALEENNIPIDYITGTSMGSIVGSMYAIGLSPEEMIALLKSESFSQWNTGKVTNDDTYYYNRGEITPGLLKFSARLGADGHDMQVDKEEMLEGHEEQIGGSKKDRRSITANVLPIALRNGRQMNLGMIEVFARPNAAAGRNFDNLFVPYRCVASDVNNRRAVIHRSGDLGDAVRSSMSFPFVFAPVNVNGAPLYDGGMYNNFPLDIAERDFHPSYIIGSSVTKNPKEADEKELYALLAKMLMKESNFQLDTTPGIILQFTWERINSWDFGQVDKLVQQGYDSTIAHIDEIKAAVTRRVSQDELAARRAAFKAKQPALEFATIEYDGLTPVEEYYVNQYFFNKKDSLLDYNEFRTAYYELLSDEMISEVTPHVVYSEKDSAFVLHLNVRTSNQLQFDLGGDVSTVSPIQLYLRLQYQDILTIRLGEHKQRPLPLRTWFDAHLGHDYNAFSIGLRTDFKRYLFQEATIVSSQHNHFGDTRFKYLENNTINFRQRETYFKYSLGTPITQKTILEIGASVGYLHDTYAKNNIHAVLDSLQEDSRYYLVKPFFKFSWNSLDNQMYPTRGHRWYIKGQIPYGTQETTMPWQDWDFEKDVEVFTFDTITTSNNWWLEARGHYEGYFCACNWFSIGLETEFVYASTHKHKLYRDGVYHEGLINSTSLSALRIQMPHYAPTPHSKLVYNDGFSSNQYAALGIKPIFLIKNNLQLRLEAYGFLPLEQVGYFYDIYRGDENITPEEYDERYSEITYINVGNPKWKFDPKFIVEGALVYNFGQASASIFGNWYSYPSKNWNIGLNIGILLFKEKFL